MDKHIERINRFTDIDALAIYRANAERLEALELLPIIDERVKVLVMESNPEAVEQGLTPTVKWVELYEREGSYVSAHYQVYWVKELS
tara:strand:+ start:48 stop:308 length:261 start_codon:yes stop_codon:yes gene_type:complete